MKKALSSNTELYHIVDGKVVEGVHDKIRGNFAGIFGNVTGITGDVSGIVGDVSGIVGNVTGITGDVTGISGNVSGITGNLDDCEITDEERNNGVDINDLIGE